MEYDFNMFVFTFITHLEVPFHKMKFPLLINQTNYNIIVDRI